MTYEQQEQIINLRKKGYGYRLIGQMLNLNRDTVRYFCKSNGMAGVAGNVLISDGASLVDTGALEEELETVTEELSVIAKKTQDAIAENAWTAQDQEEYELRYNGLVKRYEEKKARYDELNRQIADVRARAELVRNFIKILRNLDGTVEEFDPGLWGGMIEKVTVHSKDKVDFTFKGELYTITVG